MTLIKTVGGYLEALEIAIVELYFTPSDFLVWIGIGLGKNDLLAMKQILYDMGPLTLARWPL